MGQLYAYLIEGILRTIPPIQTNDRCFFMRFPPLKADRCLLCITLAPDDDAPVRYAALRAVLKACRLHPLGVTPGAVLAIVEEEALRAHLDEVRAALGTGDMLHLITAAGDRLTVEVVRSADAQPLSHPWWLDAGKI